MKKGFKDDRNHYWHKKRVQAAKDREFYLNVCLAFALMAALLGIVFNAGSGM